MKQEIKADALYVVPGSFIKAILDNQEKILDLIAKRQSEDGINGWITESRAREILNKKTTWFWHLRRNGRLDYRKIGQTVYYPKAAINSLLEDGK